MKLEKDILIPANLEINPYTYLDIILKFEFYLRLINNFGGYMFLQHVYKFSEKSKLQTFKDVHTMKDSSLLKIINVNNNSYVLLTRASIKYLKNKPNVAHLNPPTSTQLKTCSYLAEYILNPEEFFNPGNPYKLFLEKYKLEIEKYKNDEKPDIEFLTTNKEKVKIIKDEEIKSTNKTDLFSKLNASRIYYNTIEFDIVNLLILDFDRTKYWISKVIFDKIEPIFKILLIYKGYNIKILTSSEKREKRLKKDVQKMNTEGVIFLKNIDIINLNTDRFFQSTTQKESFLKDIDKLEIAKIQEKLKNSKQKR